MSRRVPVKKPLNLPADFFFLLACGLFVGAGYWIWKPLGLLFGAAVSAAVAALLILGRWGRR